MRSCATTARTSPACASIRLTVDMAGPGFVAMAVYRPDRRLLERQISSLIGQVEANWTCLIGIDGADAATRRMVQELIKHDDRMRVREYTDNQGVYRHFERLLSEMPADAQWVALSDQDDVWHPTKLARLTGALESTAVTAVTCQARLVDVEGRLLGHTDRKSAGLSDLLLRNQVTGSLTVFTGDTTRAALPFPPATPEAMHDHWLAVCAAGMGQVRLIDEPFQDYVQHAGNVLGEETATTMRETVATMRANGGVRSHLDRIARDRWGWRVNMARGLTAGGLVATANDRAVVRKIADGGVSMVLVRSAVSSWWSGRLRGRAVASTLVSAWWFAHNVDAEPREKEEGEL